MLGLLMDKKRFQFGRVVGVGGGGREGQKPHKEPNVNPKLSVNLSHIGKSSFGLICTSIIMMSL